MGAVDHETTAGTGETTIATFLEAVDARTPAPAGGAAAGLNAALGASLLAMVARYTSGERYADRAEEMLGYVEELAALRRRALDTVGADQDAFGAVAAAYERPKDGEEERAARSAAIQEAMAGATAPPLALAAICARLAELARVLTERGHQPVRSDAGTGAACVAAAAEGTLINLMANAAMLHVPELRARLAEACEALRRDRDGLRALVDAVQASYVDR